MDKKYRGVEEDNHYFLNEDGKICGIGWIIIFFFRPSAVCEFENEIGSSNKQIWYIFSLSFPFKIDMCLRSIFRVVGVLPSAFGCCSKNVTSIRVASMISILDSRAARHTCFLFGQFLLNYCYFVSQVLLPSKILCFSLAYFLAFKYLLVRNCRQKLN